MGDKLPMVLVEWEDAYTRGTGTWAVIDAQREWSPMIMSLVGHLVREDDKVVAVASELDSEGSVRFLHYIPRVLVRSVVRLRRRDGGKEG